MIEGQNGTEHERWKCNEVLVKRFRAAVSTSSFLSGYNCWIPHLNSVASGMILGFFELISISLLAQVFNKVSTCGLPITQLRKNIQSTIWRCSFSVVTSIQLISSKLVQNRGVFNDVLSKIVRKFAAQFWQQFIQSGVYDLLFRNKHQQDYCSIIGWSV